MSLTLDTTSLLSFSSSFFLPYQPAASQPPTGLGEGVCFSSSSQAIKATRKPRVLEGHSFISCPALFIRFSFFFKQQLALWLYDLSRLISRYLAYILPSTSSLPYTTNSSLQSYSTARSTWSRFTEEKEKEKEEEGKGREGKEKHQEKFKDKCLGIRKLW
jgi:hypothetical protein